MLALHSINTRTMYTLKFSYDASTTPFIQDVNTFSFATLLMLRGVYTSQPSADLLVFDSESDLNYAILAYTGTASLEWMSV